VGWVLTAYLLSASIATPIIGRLGDMYGKERLLMIVLLMLALGTLISAVASSLWLMILGRVIQGAGGGIFPLASSIIRDEFPRGTGPGFDRPGLLPARNRRRRRRGLCGRRHRKTLLPLGCFWLPLAIIVLHGILTRATSLSRRSRRRGTSTTARRA